MAGQGRIASGQSTILPERGAAAGGWLADARMLHRSIFRFRCNMHIFRHRGLTSRLHRWGARRRYKYGRFSCCVAAFAAIRGREKASALIFAICCLYALLRRLNIDTVTFDMVLCTT
jgi:hypothetical protein